MPSAKCSGGAMIGRQCPHAAKWINQNGVICCDYHKLLLNAFTWDSRNLRTWEIIKPVLAVNPRK